MQSLPVRRQRRQLFVIATVALVTVALFILFVMVIAGWNVFAVGGVTFGFILLGCAHYFIWGRQQELAEPASVREPDPALRRGRPS